MCFLTCNGSWYNLCLFRCWRWWSSKYAHQLYQEMPQWWEGCSGIHGFLNRATCTATQNRAYVCRWWMLWIRLHIVDMSMWLAIPFWLFLVFGCYICWLKLATWVWLMKLQMINLRAICFYMRCFYLHQHQKPFIQPFYIFNESSGLRWWLLSSHAHPMVLGVWWCCWRYKGGSKIE